MSTDSRNAVRENRRWTDTHAWSELGSEFLPVDDAEIPVFSLQRVACLPFFDSHGRASCIDLFIADHSRRVRGIARPVSTALETFFEGSSSYGTTHLVKLP